MKKKSWKPRLSGLMVVAIASSAGVFSACSKFPPTETQAQQPTAINTDSSRSPDSPAMPSGMGRMGHGMELGPADAEYDLRFIDAMIPHHQGAVVMAKEVLQKSKRPEMKQLATAIITAQNKEIAQMKQWRKAWYPKAPSTPMAWHGQMGHMMTMSPEQMQGMMMQMDLGAGDAQFDLRFLNAMIPHHEGAIVMAKDLLEKSKRPEIRKLAQNILTSQAAEIEQMQQWRQRWYQR